MSESVPWSSNLTKNTAPGVLIDHSPARTKQYIGSPGIAALDSGEYIASHDIFGPGSNSDTTCVFSSKDQGQTWQKIALIGGQFWSSLFVHRGSLYLMGTSKEYGFGIMRKSIDGGKTWSAPKNADCGLLLAEGMYHCAPVPLVTYNGRLWRAMEEYTGPKWGAFHAFIMSIEEDADLLKASNWVQTNRVLPNTEWLGGQFEAFALTLLVKSSMCCACSILRSMNMQL